MLTITFHWFYIPIALALAAFLSFYIGSRQDSGYWWGFEGLWEFLIGSALLIAAIVSLITGLIA